MHDIVGFSSVHKNSATVDERADLAALSATVRTAHAGVTLAATNLIEHALKAGDALIAAKAAVGHGCWLPWLKEECDLSEDRAERYMRIARGRAVLEVDSARARNLSLTGVLKLLPSPRRKRGTSRRKTTQGAPSFDVLGWWSAVPLEARRHFIDSVGSRPLAAAIPPDWNMRLAPAGESVGQIAGLHRQIATLQAEVQQRDVTIRRLHHQLGLRSDDAVAVPDDGLDIPACLRRAVPA
jgi:DUF3102 family protein